MVLSCCTNEEVRKRWHEAVETLVGHDIAAVSDMNGLRAHLQNNPDELVLLHLQSVGSEYRAFVADLLKSFPDSKLIVFSNTPNDEEGIAVLRLGALGYCNTYIMPGLLQKAVSGAYNGQVWVGQELLQHLMANLPKAPLPPERTGESGRLETLTVREGEIARRIAEGKGNATIADELGIAERTVKENIRAIFGKVGVTDRLQLGLLVKGIHVLRQNTKENTERSTEPTPVPT